MDRIAQQYDVVIVGAGLVGLSLALALSDAPFSVALLERNWPDFATQSAQYHRPISLSYASYQILTTLGVTAQLADVAMPIERVVVSEQGVFGQLSFDARLLDLAMLGMVVPYGALLQQLYQSVLDKGHVQLLQIEGIDGIERDQSGLIVHTHQQGRAQSLHGRTVVGCDGSDSTVRQLAGISNHVTATHMQALTAQLRLDRPFGATAYQRFNKNGIFALLPLHDQRRCGLVVSAPADFLETLTTDDQLLAAVRSSFGRRLAGCIGVERGASYPLRTSTAAVQYEAGVLLLGNAARTVYPLAAQGFNLGLRDVAVCAERLAGLYRDQGVVGSDRLFADFVSERRDDQQSVTTLTRGISHLFSHGPPGASVLRGLGLLALDLAVPAKRLLARRLTGMQLPPMMVFEKLSW